MNNSLNRSSDIVFMALVIWREARGESEEARVAVGYSILDRVYRPSWWGKTVTEVLFKKWQYSSMTNPKDKQLTSWPASADFSWQECLSIANEVLSGTVENPVPGADSYYDISILPPKWAEPQMFIRQIGRLVFFNTDISKEKAS